MNCYDYGARNYDPEIARWHTQDPEQESHYSWNGYNYVRNNPILKIDPNGMSDDNFYLTQKNEVAYYEENDDPDRVFVAKDDQVVYDNLENATDKSMYNEVEMSDTEIEEIMNDNGFKKVVKEAKVEKTDRLQLHSAEGGAMDPVTMNVPINNRVTALSHKYVDKSEVRTGKTSSETDYSRRAIPKQDTWEFTSVSIETYKYGTKGTRNRNRASSGAKKAGKFASDFVPWEDVARSMFNAVKK